MRQRTKEKMIRISASIAESLYKRIAETSQMEHRSISAQIAHLLEKALRS